MVISSTRRKLNDVNRNLKINGLDIKVVNSVKYLGVVIDEKLSMEAILHCDRYTAVDDILNVLLFMSIEQRIALNVCIFLYKAENELLPKFICNKINKVLEKHNYNTRNKENIKAVFRRITSGQKGIF